MRPIAAFLFALPACLGVSFVLARSAADPPCLMQPTYFKMTLPKQGFEWLENENLTGPCTNVPAKNWIRKPSGAQALFVAAEGPEGSGRFWTITVGVGKRSARKPERGVCFITSTLGWRTLQAFKKVPLAWLDDVDKDGQAELVVWSSFALNPDASEAEYGLVAWVYQLSEDGLLTMDLAQSRKMARELAAAYRAPLDSQPPPGELRSQAATALESLAREGCILPSFQSSVLGRP